MDEPDRLPLAQKALNVLIDQLRPEDRVSMVVYAGAAGAVLAPTPGTPEAEDPLRRRRAPRRRLDRRRRGPGARLHARRAELRQGRGQPRHPDDRRRLQRRHRRSREAQGFRRREAQDRHLSLGLRLRPRQLQRRDDADAVAERQRHRRLRRHPRGSAGSSSATTSPARSFRSPTTSRSRSSSIRHGSPNTG